MSAGVAFFLSLIQLGGMPASAAAGSVSYSLEGEGSTEIREVIDLNRERLKKHSRGITSVSN